MLFIFSRREISAIRMRDSNRFRLIYGKCRFQRVFSQFFSHSCARLRFILCRSASSGTVSDADSHALTLGFLIDGLEFFGRIEVVLAGFVNDAVSVALFPEAFVGFSFDDGQRCFVIADVIYFH